MRSCSCVSAGRDTGASRRDHDRGLITRRPPHERQMSEHAVPISVRLSAEGHGSRTDDFRSSCSVSCRSTSERSRPGKIEERPSKDGTYLSLTCTFKAQSREQLDALYRELTSCERSCSCSDERSRNTALSFSRRHANHDLAGRFAAIQDLERIGEALEPISSVTWGLIFPSLNSLNRPCRFCACTAGSRRVCAPQNTPTSEQPFSSGRFSGIAGILPTGKTDHEIAPIPAPCCARFVRQVGADRIVGDIDAAVASELHDLGLDGIRRVVEHSIRAVLFRQRELFIRARSQPALLAPRALPISIAVNPTPPAAPEHEQCFARFELRALYQRVIRRAIVHKKPGCGSHAHGPGNGISVAAVGDAFFCEPALPAIASTRAPG